MERILRIFGPRHHPRPQHRSRGGFRPVGRSFYGPTYTATRDLPRNTREQFIAAHLEDLTECCICFEAFDQDKHRVTRFTGPNACGHIFGSECLRTWLRSDNVGASKCPTCRRQLYQPVEEPQVSNNPLAISNPLVINHPQTNSGGITHGIVMRVGQDAIQFGQIEAALRHFEEQDPDDITDTSSLDTLGYDYTEVVELGMDPVPFAELRAFSPQWLE